MATVILAGVAAFFSAQPRGADNQPDNANTPVARNGDNAPAENTPVVIENRPVEPPPPREKAPQTIDDLIDGMRKLETLGLPADRARLSVWFAGSPDKLSALTKQDIALRHSQLRIVKFLLEREGLPPDRADKYDTQGNGTIVLVRDAGNGLRISLD